MKYINLSEELFKELYPNHDISIFKEEPKSDEDFIYRYLSCKLWRLNNLYTIVDKAGETVPFRMNYAQNKVYSSYLEHIRLIILKSRQQGISTFWLICFFDDAIFNENYSIGLMAQGADEAQTLLERVKFSWDHLDQSIKEFLGVSNVKDNAKAFSFSNGSTIFIRTSFRSATLQRLHISELGKIANKYPDKAKETNTGTLQTLAKGSGLAIESTAEGDNMFKEKWDIAWNHSGAYGHKDLKAVFLSWVDDPDCVSAKPEIITPKHEEYFENLELAIGKRLTKEQKWFWIMQERELSSDDEHSIFQEYPGTPEEAFNAVRQGKYYSKTIQRHVISKNRYNLPDLYDPALPVIATMDLGMNDEFVIGYFQRWRNEHRLIGDYHNSGEGLEHYYNQMKSQPFPISKIILPHDAKVKELSTGQSRVHALRALGARRITVLPKLSIHSGIEAVRQLLTMLWIAAEADYTFTCLKNYSKEWDNTHNCWKDRPLHNDYSHGADMVRYYATYCRLFASTKTNTIEQKSSKVVVDKLCL